MNSKNYEDMSYSGFNLDLPNHHQIVREVCAKLKVSSNFMFEVEEANSFSFLIIHIFLAHRSYNCSNLVDE